MEIISVEQRQSDSNIEWTKWVAIERYRQTQAKIEVGLRRVWPIRVRCELAQNSEETTITIDRESRGRKRQF